MNLLFVDDDPRVLAGLRRRLHGRRADWQLEFAPGGAEALAALDGRRFDAVVSDMRMPVVDGSRVLAEVARRQPRAARLVLSGHAEGRDGQREGSCAHRILGKPCATEALAAEIAAAVALRGQLDGAGCTLLDALWSRAPGLVDGLPAVLASLSGDGPAAADLAPARLDDEAAWRLVLGVAAAVRSDALALDATPRRVLAVLGARAVLAVLAGAAVQQAAGDDWTSRLARGVALAVAAHAAGRARSLQPDELDDVLLAALLQPLAGGDEDRAPRLAWLLASWGIPPRAVAALAPDGGRGAVGQALAAALGPAEAPSATTGLRLEVRDPSPAALK